MTTKQPTADESADRERPSSESQATDASGLSRRRFVQASATVGVGAFALGTGAGADDDIVREDCENWATFELGEGNWHLLNNRWGMPDSDQCIREYEDGSYGHEFTAVGDGINYPEVFCGSRPWSSTTGVPEFPVQRSEVDELVLEWDTEIDIEGGDWNLAEEWWLLEGEPDPSSPGITHEVMLVLDWGGGHGHYMEEEDIARDQFGNQLDHWADYDHSEGWNFHIFRIAEGAESGKVDLTEIRDYLTEEYDVDEELTMTGIEVGNEYWEGAAGEVTFNYCDLSVNGTTYESGIGRDDEDVIEVGDYDTQDTTDDGLHNDFTGDGQTGFEDVNAFADNLDDEAVQKNPDAFDFAGNDRIGFADVLELLRMV